MSERVQFNLDADRIRTAWFNINPALPGQPLPPLHPGTHEPIGPADLAPLFPEALIMQEVSMEPWIDIPAPSSTSTDCGGRPLDPGPSPGAGVADLARIYFKYEGPRRRGRTSPTPRWRRPTTTRRPVPAAW